MQVPWWGYHEVVGTLKPYHLVETFTKCFTVVIYHCKSDTVQNFSDIFVPWSIDLVIFHDLEFAKNRQFCMAPILLYGRQNNFSCSTVAVYPTVNLTNSF